MKITKAIQEGLLALLCYDAKGSNLVRALVPVKMYDPIHRDLAEAVDHYIEQYKKPPGEHTFDLLETLSARNPDREDQYTALYRSVLTNKDGMNREYLLKEAGRFVMGQRIKAVLKEVTTRMRAETPTSIEESMALMSGIGQGQGADLISTGLLLNDPAQALSFLDTLDEEAMLTGVRELDEIRLGPTRKQQWMMIAPPNRGKSWDAVHKGKVNLLAGRRVLHITLEMSEPMVAQRYIHSMFSVSKRELKDLTVRFFDRDELGRFLRIDERVLKDRPHLQQENIRPYLLERLRPMKTRPKLIIKQFPSGALTIRQLKGYLDYLENVQGFIPDLLLIDYPDLMDVDANNKRASLSKIYVDLRGLAVERNMAQVVYSQSNRLGMASKLIDMTKVAEDFSKNATADTVITFNQTDAEQEVGLARLYVAKARSEIKHFQVLISQCYGIGQFCMDSAKMEAKKYWSSLPAGEEDEEDGK